MSLNVTKTTFDLGGGERVWIESGGPLTIDHRRQLAASLLNVTPALPTRQPYRDDLQGVVGEVRSIPPISEPGKSGSAMIDRWLNQTQSSNSTSATLSPIEQLSQVLGVAGQIAQSGAHLSINSRSQLTAATDQALQRVIASWGFADTASPKSSAEDNALSDEVKAKPSDMLAAAEMAKTGLEALLHKDSDPLPLFGASLGSAFHTLAHIRLLLKGSPTPADDVRGREAGQGTSFAAGPGINGVSHGFHVTSAAGEPAPAGTRIGDTPLSGKSIQVRSATSA